MFQELIVFSASFSEFLSQGPKGYQHREDVKSTGSYRLRGFSGVAEALGNAQLAREHREGLVLSCCHGGSGTTFLVPQGGPRC